MYIQTLTLSLALRLVSNYSNSIDYNLFMTILLAVITLIVMNLIVVIILAAILLVRILLVVAVLLAVITIYRRAFPRNSRPVFIAFSNCMASYNRAYTPLKVNSSKALKVNNSKLYIFLKAYIPRAYMHYLIASKDYMTTMSSNPAVSLVNGT